MIRQKPLSVKVGAVVYTIEYDIDMTPLGSCDPEEVAIKIRKYMAPSRVKQTLLHEILHACFYETVGTVSDDKKMSQERATISLEGPLFGVLRENPILLKWLTS